MSKENDSQDLPGGKRRESTVPQFIARYSTVIALLGGAGWGTYELANTARRDILRIEVSITNLGDGVKKLQQTLETLVPEVRELRAVGQGRDRELNRLNAELESMRNRVRTLELKVIAGGRRGK